MKRRIITRWIAVFVAVLLLPWGMFPSADMKTVEASTTITSPDDLAAWTPKEAIATLTYGTPATTGLGGTISSEVGSLNGTVFKTRVKFPTQEEMGTGNNINVYVGGVNNTRSYLLQAINGQLRMLIYGAGETTATVNLRPSDFGMTGDTLLGQELDLMITTEFVGYTAGDTSTDVNVGLYINHTLYGGTYLQLKDWTITTGYIKQMQIIHNSAAGGPTFNEYQPLITSPDTLTAWTPADANIAYGTALPNVGGTISNAQGSLNGTVFKVRAKFPTQEEMGSGNNINMHVGGNNNARTYLLQAINGQLRILFYSAGTAQKTVNLSPSDFGMTGTTLLGQELDLMITTEFVGYTEGDTTADIHVGLYINDVLYGGDYIQLENISVTAGYIKQMQIIHNSAAGGPIFGTYGEAFVEPEPEPEPEPELTKGFMITPEELNVWTPADAGFTYGTALAHNSGGTVQPKVAGNLNGTTFKTKVTFPSTLASGQSVNFWIGGTEGMTYVIQAAAGKSTLDFMHYPSRATSKVTLNPDTFGLETFLGQEFELAIATEFVGYTEGDTTTDVNVRLYINGILYGGGYIELKDQAVANFVKQCQIKCSAATVPGPTLNAPTAKPVKFGDVNYDGQHTSVDLVHAKQVVSRGLHYKSLDFYSDGVSGADDMAFMRTTLVGESSFIEYHTTLGFLDFGYANDLAIVYGGAEGNSKQLLIGTDTMDGVLVEGTYVLTGSPIFDIGHSWGGVQFTRSGDGLQYQYVDKAAVGGVGVIADTTKVVSAEMAGVENMFGSELDISAGFTFRNANAETSTADVTVEIRIGDYYDVFTVKGVKTASLRQLIYLYTAAAGDSITLKAKQYTYNEYLSFADFDQPQEYTLSYVDKVAQADFTNGNGDLNGVMLAGRYLLSGTGIILEYGGRWRGVQLQYDGGGLSYSYADTGGSGTKKIKTVTATDVGCELYDNEIYIALGFTFENVDTAAGTADVAVELLIGDTYRDVFVVKNAIIANLNRHVHLYAAKAGDSITIMESPVALSFDAIGGDDVMPIGGFYGPSLPKEISGDAGAIIDHYTDDIFGKIDDAGVNLLLYPNARYNLENETALVEKTLILAEQYNMGVFVNDSNFSTAASASAITQNAVQAQLAKYQDRAAFCGVFVVDEPLSDNYKPSSLSEAEIQKRWMASFAPLYQKLDKLGVVGFSNLMPKKDVNAADYNTYIDYVAEYAETCAPAYLSFDYYVWDEDTSTAGYFCNMNVIRNQAKASGIPFWSFVQAGGYWESTSVGGSYVSKEKFNWSVNTALACGAKGISYFPLIQPTSFTNTLLGTNYTRSGMIGADGSVNEWHAYAKDANVQIAAVDEVLMNAVNKGIITSGTGTFKKETFGTATTISADTAYFEAKQDQTWEELASVSGDALIGCFKYNGKTALYVVNYDYTSTANKDITLTFDADCTLSQTKAGTTTSVSTMNKSLTLNMSGGEGILLVF